MSEPLIAIAGDLHLSPYVTKDVLEMQGDSVYALQQIAAFCRQNKCPLVLAGDVFDTRNPNSLEVLHLRNEVKRMESEGLTVWGIQGQHDMSDPSWTAVTGAYPLHGASVNLDGGRTLFGLDYTPRSQLLERLPNVPKCDILVLHQMLAEAIHFRGTDGPVYDLELADIPSHVGLVVLGDVHEPYENPYHTPPVYYTGSTHLRSISEPLTKSFIVVQKDLSVVRKPLDARPFKLYELFSEDGLVACLQELKDYQPETAEQRPEIIAIPYIVVRYSRELERARERILAAADGRFHLRLLPAGAVEQIGQETQEVQGSVTLEGCLDEFINKDQEPELYTFVKELVSMEDARPVIARWREKVTGD